jgi:hypothetical protein
MMTPSLVLLLLVLVLLPLLSLLLHQASWRRKQHAEQHTQTHARAWRDPAEAATVGYKPLLLLAFGTACQQRCCSLK